MSLIQGMLEKISQKIIGLVADPTTYALLTSDYSTYKLNVGQSYEVVISSKDVQTTPLHLNFTVPTIIPGVQERRVHMSLGYGGEDRSALVFTKNPTGITGGSLLTPRNRRGESANASIMQGAMYSGASLPTGGGDSFTVWLGGAAGFASGADPLKARRILEPGASYSISIDGDAKAIAATLILSWYELKDKEVVPGG